MPNETADLTGLSGSHQRLVHLLRRSAPASRAELAALCGLTPAAVSMLVQDLIARGIVVESGRRQGHRGPPQIDLMLTADAGHALGIHADYFSVYLTVLDFRGEMKAELKFRNSFSSFDSVATAIEDGTSQILSAGQLSLHSLVGAGFALPTRFRKEVLNLADDIKSWTGINIAANLSARLGCPVTMENDANAAAIGELSIASPASHNSFFYLYLSSGIGGSVVLEGKVHRGHLGNSGEIGALQPRNGPRPSFDDLAEWFRRANVTVPEGRDPDEWENVLESHPDVTEAWLLRAGPQAANLAFAAHAILEPPAIYVGGTLPRSLRLRFTEWMDFSRGALFNGATLSQPEILLPERPARSSASAGAAAMILHQLGNTQAKGAYDMAVA